MTHRKRILLLFVLSVMVIAACSAPVMQDMEEAAKTVLDSQKDMPPMTVWRYGESGFSEVLERLYGIDPQTVSGGIIETADGLRAEQLAILTFTDNDGVHAAQSALEAFADAREESYAGYAPEAKAMISSREIVRSGRTLFFIVCPDPRSAAKAAESAAQAGTRMTAASSPDAVFSGESSPVSSWSSENVLASLKGDKPSLSMQEFAVAEEVRRFLEDRISADMTICEKVLAAEDFLSEKTDYDTSVLDLNPFTVPSEENTNPYGALIEGAAICYGFSSSFQLLMDALGIPCITIDGQTQESHNDHSWNMVMLDGSWYHVDVTWDNPVNGEPSHKYFLQTDDFMHSNGPHWWDTDEVPASAPLAYSPPA